MKNFDEFAIDRLEQAENKSHVQFWAIIQLVSAVVYALLDIADAIRHSKN